MILRLAVSVEHRRVTDGRTDRRRDIRRQLIPALASVARVKPDNIIDDVKAEISAVTDVQEYKTQTMNTFRNRTSLIYIEAC